MVQYTDLIALWVIIRRQFNVFVDCNEEYVVLHISLASFVITDFKINICWSWKDSIRDSIRILTPDAIRDSIRTQLADSQVPIVVITVLNMFKTAYIHHWSSKSEVTSEVTTTIEVI